METAPYTLHNDTELFEHQETGDTVLIYEGKNAEQILWNHLDGCGFQGFTPSFFLVDK